MKKAVIEIQVDDNYTNDNDSGCKGCPAYDRKDFKCMIAPIFDNFSCPVIVD